MDVQQRLKFASGGSISVGGVEVIAMVIAEIGKLLLLMKEAMREIQRADLIELLIFITGGPAVFYKHMTDDQLAAEYQRLSNRK